VTTQIETIKNRTVFIADVAPVSIVCTLAVGDTATLTVVVDDVAKVAVTVVVVGDVGKLSVIVVVVDGVTVIVGGVIIGSVKGGCVIVILVSVSVVVETGI
jgi:hypothetical protein